MSDSARILDSRPSAVQTFPTPAPERPPSRGPAAPPTRDTYALSNDINAPYSLGTAERNWASIQRYLLSVNYMLRPRYHLGWTGSWVGTRKRASKCEDSIPLGDHRIVIDAVHTIDGRQVLLKLWSRKSIDGPELDVLRYFSDPIRASDPRNHVVPLLDTVTISGHERYFDRILVEPLLRDFTEPPFVMVAEALCFVRQILEGLEYMHANNVAHGDIHNGNIMMDAGPIFPDGFHGAFSLNRERRLSERRVKCLTRIQAPVKYYFIDFGSSFMFPSRDARTLVHVRAAALFPPEFKANPEAPLDPFKQDIFALGLTMVDEMRLRPGLHFIIPLFATAIDDDPSKRPTAGDLKADFELLLSTLTPYQMRRRIGWTRDSGITLFDWLWDVREYLRLLWHSYRYGLPRELFPSVKPH